MCVSVCVCDYHYCYNVVISPFTFYGRSLHCVRQTINVFNLEPRERKTDVGASQLLSSYPQYNFLAFSTKFPKNKNMFSVLFTACWFFPRLFFFLFSCFLFLFSLILLAIFRCKRQTRNICLTIVCWLLKILFICSILHVSLPLFSFFSLLFYY